MLNPLQQAALTALEAAGASHALITMAAEEFARASSPVATPREPLLLTGVTPPPWSAEIARMTPDQFGRGEVSIGLLMALYSYVNLPTTPIADYEMVKRTTGWRIQLGGKRDMPYVEAIQRFLHPETKSLYNPDRNAPMDVTQRLWTSLGEPKVTSTGEAVSNQGIPVSWFPKDPISPTNPAQPGPVDVAIG